MKRMARWRQAEEIFTSLWGGDQAGASHLGPAAAPGEKTLDRSRAHPFFASDLPLRLCLLGLAVGIQGYDELPIGLLIGRPVAAVLSFLAMTLSLVCICLAVSPRLPGWLIGKVGFLVGRVAVTGCLVLGVLGLGYVGLISFEVFQSPVYYNDGTLLDHNAALLVLRGQNPYTQSDIVAAIRDFHQPAVYTTPLQQGKLANQHTYPSDEQLQALFAQEPVGQPAQALEFESHVSYPALAFLVLIPLVWAGAPTVMPFYLLCLALLAVIGLRFVRRDLRWWVALLFLADLPVLNSTLSGSLDLFYILLIFLAWLSYRRWWLSAVLLGLALASKQIAWYYAPFYLIFIYQRYGARDAARRFALASALFVALNLPFLALNTGAWVVGVLAPVRDPMFPEGAGLIALSIGNLVPFLPREAYTLLEGVGMVGALLWYWRWGRARPEAAMVLAVLPLFLAWRSLPSYFYFCALPIALLLAMGNNYAPSTIAPCSSVPTSPRLQLTTQINGTNQRV